jgi:hypothetical protein
MVCPQQSCTYESIWIIFMCLRTNIVPSRQAQYQDCCMRSVLNLLHDCARYQDSCVSSVLKDQVQSSYSHCSYGHSSYPQSSYARSSYGSKLLRLTVPTDSMFLQLQSSYSSKFLHFKVPMGAQFQQLQSSYWFKVHTVSMFLLVQSSYISKFLQVQSFYR